MTSRALARRGFILMIETTKRKRPARIDRVDFRGKMKENHSVPLDPRTPESWKTPEQRKDQFQRGNSSPSSRPKDGRPSTGKPSNPTPRSTGRDRP